MKNLIFLGILLVFLTGCTVPFSPNNRNVVAYQGRVYSIPYGVNYGLINQDLQRIYRNSGLNCSVGDVIWMNSKTLKQIDEYIKKYPFLAFTAMYRLEAVRGNQGCSRPLTDQELAFYMHQQNIAIQQAQLEQQQWNAIQDRISQSAEESSRRLRETNQMMMNKRNNNANRDININVYGGNGWIMPQVKPDYMFQ